ncbi:UDP-glucose 4-epimerase GalE [Isoptericola chiayiensis]|uniref:UDP-glucose 4-epimerase n=2 Tax=Isoptericola chiayiensis TaxID=579446 RepID=A0ABP8Y8B4_9MICO|nr:UDP-glucose 4-epimerase GalE [Isoptericola chiayiensis]NOW00672.1 UDP-glucose 4-epimerase [Isoptericola chiayiensis]
MRVLVTGGAGYLGCHVVLALLTAGHDVDVVDDFTRGTPASLARVEHLAGRHVTTHAADVADIDAVERIFATGRFDAVVHLAGLRSTDECHDRVLDAYETNLATTFALLRCMAWYGVQRFVLSSSAAVYGGSDDGTPLAESARIVPSSPLGRSMATNEHLLTDLAAAGAVRVAVVRCFTTAGAHPSGRIGELAKVPGAGLVARIGEVVAGQRPHLAVHGGDHPTHDGTPVRDFVHVADAAEGHVAALEGLDDTSRAVTTWNLGTGVPTSVLDVLRRVERVLGREIPHRIVDAPARTVASVVADVTRTTTELGWAARRTLDDVVRDHWRWHQSNPHGYPPTVTPETPWRGGVGHRLRLVPPPAAVNPN